MPEHPVTRPEMRGDIAAAEARSLAAVDSVVAHFDQRLKDSERVLTWRMVATAGAANILGILIDFGARGDASVASSVIGWVS